MRSSNIKRPNQRWFKGSRDRGLRVSRNYKVRKIDQYKHEVDVPELLQLKKIQELWDSEENSESIAA